MILVLIKLQHAVAPFCVIKISCVTRTWGTKSWMSGYTQMVYLSTNSHQSK